MRKFFSFIMIFLVMALSSCIKMEKKSSFSETKNNSTEISKETKKSIIVRVFQSPTPAGSVYYVLLEDNTILEEAINCTLHQKPSEFFFLQKGDTVVYSGDEVIEIRFKGE